MLRQRRASPCSGEVLREWTAKYSQQEVERLSKQRVEDGKKLIEDELAKVIGDIDEATADLRKEIHKTVRPLSTSPIQSDIQRAQFYDQQARDIVRAVGLQGLPAEYEEAMKHGAVELGSSLIDWAERLMDQEDPRDFEVFVTTKKRHIVALGFQDKIDSIEALEKTRKDLTMRIGWLEAGHSPRSLPGGKPRRDESGPAGFRNRK